MNTKISVAMATYNGSSFIRDQLDSIYHQTRTVDEVIICDDHSTDNTLEIINQYIDSRHLKYWKVIKNETRLGFCGNFWKAVGLCSGEIVFLSDQDDVWYPDRVENMTTVLLSSSDINMVACSYDLCDQNNNLINKNIPFNRSNADGKLEDIPLKNIIQTSAIRGCSIAFKRKILKGEQLLDLKNGPGHDWLISCYAATKGRVVFINRRLFRYRIHATNASKDTKSYLEKLLHSDKRHLAISEERRALTVLLSMQSNVASNKKFISRQLSFVHHRDQLLNHGRLLYLAILPFYIFKYINIYRQGIFGGAKGYIGDALYTIIRASQKYHLKKDKDTY